MPRGSSPGTPDKDALRAGIRAARRARTDAERAADADRLARAALAAPALRAVLETRGTVGCFCSGPTEPGTAPLRAALRAVGVRVLLPVVAGDLLDWAVDDGETVPGYRGIAEPPGPRLGPSALAGCAAVLVPALAADTAGRRLGQGGGYYDRSLAAVRPPGPVVAVVHDDELLDAGVRPLPVESHDVRVDAVLTPSRWIDVQSSGHPCLQDPPA